MIHAIVAAVSFATIIAVTGMLVAKGADFKKQYDDKLRVMADQVNNAQYYDAQVDKQNIDNIKDVRRTYTSKDELARNVDTRHMQAQRTTTSDLQAGTVTGEYQYFKKSAADVLRADRLVSANSVMSSLDAQQVNANKANIFNQIQWAGSNTYNMQKDTIQTPENIPFSFKDATQSQPQIQINPTKAQLQFDNKFAIGKSTNPEADKLGMKYDMLAVNFDNKELVGLYNTPEGTITRMQAPVDIYHPEASYLMVSSESTDPMFLANTKDFQGIMSFSSNPFHIWSDNVKVGNIHAKHTESSIAGIRFADTYDETKQQTPQMINNNTSFTITAPEVNIKNKLVTPNIQSQSITGDILQSGTAFMQQNAVYGDTVQGQNTIASDVAYGNHLFATEWVTGKNTHARDFVTAGNFAAWMSKDGEIVGNNITANTISTGAAQMTKDGTVQGKTLKFEEISTDKGFNVTSGPFKLAQSVPFEADNKRFAIDPIGNVGIGTMTPQSRFHLTGGAAQIDNSDSTSTIFNKNNKNTINLQTEFKKEAQFPSSIPIHMGFDKADKNPDAGKLIYNASTSTLDIYGAGQTQGARQVAMYDQLTVPKLCLGTTCLDEQELQTLKTAIMQQQTS